MGFGVVNVGGTNVYKGQQQNFASTNTMLAETRQARDQVKSDPNLSQGEKDVLLRQISEAEQALMKALDYTTRDEGVFARKPGDKDEVLIEQNMSKARGLLDGIHSQVAAAVPPPPPPAPTDLKPIDGVDGTTASAESSPKLTAESTLPPDPKFVIDSHAAKNPPTMTNGDFNSLKTANPTDIAKAILAGTITPSNEDLRALAASDPRQFNAIMAELGQLPGGEGVAQGLVQGMQTHTQNLHRMFSMLSNLTQASHDTQKSLIQNIRV